MIEVFGIKMTAVFTLLAVGYFLLSFAPVIWPAYRVFRHRPRLDRPVLFIGVVAALVYGVFSFIAFAALLPVEIYGVYIAPSLADAGFFHGSTVLRVSNFFVRYWWLAIPPLQLILTWYVTSRIERRWIRITEAIAV